MDISEKSSGSFASCGPANKSGPEHITSRHTNMNELARRLLIIAVISLSHRVIAVIAYMETALDQVLPGIALRKALFS
jgi:hypothetical protein